MARSYNRLWHLLIDKNMTKSDLRRAAGITTNALAKLGRNDSVPVHTLESICIVLGCRIEDVVEVFPDELNKAESGGEEN